MAVLPISFRASSLRAPGPASRRHLQARASAGRSQQPAASAALRSAGRCRSRQRPCVGQPCVFLQPAHACRGMNMLHCYHCPNAADYSNPIGVHALVFAGTWDEAAAAAATRGAKAAGYDLLELAVFNAARLDVDMTRRAFAEAGLRPACSLGLSLGADVSSEDAAVVARGEAELDDALKFAAAVGSRHLCGILYSALAKYDGPPTREGRANAVMAVRALAAKAEDLGVAVCLEVVNRYESNLLNTAAQAMDFLADAGHHPNLYVHLDTYHMNIEEASFEEAVWQCGDRLGYVHIGESHRGYLGTGTVDLPAMFGALASAGYAGPITFESFSSRVVSADLSSNLCIWRNLWEDSADLAAHARRFVHGEWQAAQVAAWQAANVPDPRRRGRR